MPFSQPNLNKFLPGSYLSAENLNKMASAAAAASVNNPAGGGINSVSMSTGNSYSLAENIAKPPIWAQIVSIQRKSQPVSGSGSSSGTGPSSACPNYVYAYGWVELIEDINISRQKQEFFKISTESAISGSGSGNTLTINNSSPQDQTILECRDINALNLSVGGMTGSPDSLPAYEVNNQVVSLGTVVKLYFGQGNYMLFNNTGGGASGASSNYIDVITNVCPIFEEVEPAIGITLINTTGGIKGGPITSSGTIQLSTSGAKAGTYSNPTIVVDTYGRITQATNGTANLADLEARVASLEARVTALGG
jgi:hypothetical protein